MKIIFANPPVLRSPGANPGNDFKISGHIFKSWYGRVFGLTTALMKLGVGAGVRYGVRAGSRWPWTMPHPIEGPYPFIMGYAAALLRQNGFDVNILDAVGDQEYSYESFLKRLELEKPDIVVLECSTPTIDIDLWFAKRVAEFSKVALAGPPLTINADELMNSNKQVSFFLKGEYILSSLEMAQTLRSGIYESKVVTDLDSIPFPFRDYPASLKYYDPTMPTPRPQLQIYASKGCPFKCIYCMWPQTMYSGITSYRRPDCVAQEIHECVVRYGYKSIFFDDDTFNIGNERISMLCDKLRAIGLPWSMMGRLDCSPPWLYDKMVDCGCVGMRFGVETFDPVVLKTINKGLVSDKIVSTLQHISSKYPKLIMHLTMMNHLPGQSIASHQNDLRILNDLGYSMKSNYRNFQLSACMPFPGTELYKRMTAEGDKIAPLRESDSGKESAGTINSI